MTRRVSLALIAVTLAGSAYRAASQSVVHDEALTWQFFLAGPASEIFETYNANNHFLALVVMKVFTGLLGVSGFAMRLVSLLAAGLYAWACYRIVRRVFAEKWTGVLAMALLLLNPLVMDFFVAARGYGLALALLFFGIAEMLDEKRRPWLAGAALALSAAANLVFALPALVAFAYLQRGHGSRGFVIGAAACAILFFAFSPVGKAKSEDFYAGLPTVRESVDNLAQCALGHNAGVGGVNAENAGQKAWRGFVAYALVPLLVVAGLWLGVRGRQRSALADVTAICAVAIAVPAQFLLLSHLVRGVPLPQDRTGMYFMPLAGLLLACVVEAAPWRAASMALAAVGVLIAVQYAAQVQTRSFLTWRYDADTLTLLESAKAEWKDTTKPARVGASWQLEPSTNYYLVTQKWTWMAPMRRETPVAESDYYLLLPQDAGLVEERKLRVVRRGETSGTVLASR
jgi:4-amino-4-deoxy-L-arabinose transferase-like glycosyltransferase